MFGRRTTTSADALLDRDTDGRQDGTAVEPLWQPEARQARKSVEQLLLDQKVINEEQLTQARGVQAQSPTKSIAQILLTMNAASESQVLAATAATMGLAFENLTRDTIDA